MTQFISNPTDFADRSGASPKFWEGPNIFNLREQEYLDWDTASRSTKRQDMLDIWGA